MTNNKYDPTDLKKDEFINLYLSYLDKKNGAESTKHLYKSYFKTLKTLDWANAEGVREFLNQKYDNKRTLNCVLSIFKAFFNYLNKKNLFFFDVTELILTNASVKLKPAYNIAQFMRLEKYLKDFNNDSFSFVFYFLKHNWCRVGELDVINWDFFKTNLNGTLIIQAEKHNNERIVKVPQEARQYWTKWIKKPLKSITIKHLFAEFKTYVYQNDEEFRDKKIQISSHCLRTSGITLAASLGISATDLSGMTGHKTPNTIMQNYIVKNIKTIENNFDFVNNYNVLDQLDLNALRNQNKELNMQITKLKTQVFELMEALEVFKKIYNLDIEKAQKNTKNEKNKDKNSDDFLKIWEKYLKENKKNKGVENENIN